MANESENNIVIECSPYGDSEIEILNLKSPSYEIISMPNIFDYEKSLNIFITVAIALLGLAVTFLFLKIIGNPNEFTNSDSGKMFLYLLYVILFIVGAMISAPQYGGDLTPLYVTFGVVVAILIVIRRSLNSDQLSNAIFPGMTIAEEKKMVNIGFFTFLFVGLYLIISGIKSMADIADPFSPAGFVTSYCLLQILNYIVINSQGNTKSDTTREHGGTPWKKSIKGEPMNIP
jgi:protein-S-isoprenylcysteine O-methyltransferase Ste14